MGGNFETFTFDTDICLLSVYNSVGCVYESTGCV